MSNIVKSLGPTGDYTDLPTAVSGLIASGVADSNLSGFYLYADKGTYSGTFSITVPNSGQFFIAGSGSTWNLAGTCYISGNSDLYSFNIDNFNIYSLNSPGGIGALYIYPNTSVKISNSNFIGFKDGPTASGNVNTTIDFENVTCVGNTSGTFCNAETLYFNNSKLGDFGSGLLASGLHITNSKLLDTYTGCSGINTYISNSLIESNNRSILSSSFLDLNQSTLIGNVDNYGSKIVIKNSIIKGTGNVITSASGTIDNSCLYPDGGIGTITETNCINEDPLFNNSSSNDYRLELESPCIEVVPVPTTLSDLEFLVEELNFNLYDVNGTQFPKDQGLRFIYKNNETLLFTDYEKEVQFAKYIGSQIPYRYIQTSNVTSASFVKYDVLTKPTLSNNSGISDDYPWDWDLKTFNSPRIAKDESWIIPRSYIDLREVLKDEWDYFGETLFTSINKNNISVYNEIDQRGVSYDYNSSGPGESIIWILEGRNQTLSKQNIYNGQVLESYPLLCPTSDRSFVQPSGLVYIGVEKDKYKYIDPIEPNKIYYSTNQNFQFISTEINNLYYLYGLLVYKDNLIITGSKFNYPIQNQDMVTSNGVGVALLYNSRDIYLHYLGNFSDYTPLELTLNTENSRPTDLTTYEDGNILIADYTTKTLYKYKLNYDYALIQDSYDREIKILLRENYPNVDF